MPWARLGDNAATYPKLMQIAGYRGADDRAVNEVRGWLLACATQSAGHLTDYVLMRVRRRCSVALERRFS